MIKLHDTDGIPERCDNAIISRTMFKCQTSSLKGHRLKDLGIMMVASELATPGRKTICESNQILSNDRKRNQFRHCGKQKNLDSSYIVPIVPYGSVLWKPSESKTENYREDLKKIPHGSCVHIRLPIRLLLLSFYHELNDT